MCTELIWFDLVSIVSNANDHQRDVVLRRHCFEKLSDLVENSLAYLIRAQAVGALDGCHQALNAELFTQEREKEG